MINKLDMPQDAFVKPQTWTTMVYKWEPSRGWIPQGYTKPKIQTFYHHMGDVMGLTNRGLVTVSWVYWNGEWVRT